MCVCRVRARVPAQCVPAEVCAKRCLRASRMGSRARVRGVALRACSAYLCWATEGTKPPPAIVRRCVAQLSSAAVASPRGGSREAVRERHSQHAKAQFVMSPFVGQATGERSCGAC
eukprot:scaffold27062_cov44-Phaeocystis_antarctica.AAC.2